MAESYRAVVCTSLGPPEGLRLQRLPRQALPEGHVRVAIKAAGLNFPDVLMIQGLYQFKPELPFVPGLEAAGEIIEAGAGVTQHRVGARVIARMRIGAYAEEAVIPARDAIAMPATFGFAEAATFLVAHITSYHALLTRAHLTAGETVLVLGAAGGVGLAAVEIAAAYGARVIAVASSPEKRAIALMKGAAEAIDYVGEPLSKAVQRLTQGRGVDIVLDPVGIVSEEAIRCVVPQGRVVIAGFAGGTIPNYAANRILLKSASVIGVRAGEAARQDPALRAREQAALLQLAEDGRVRPHVSEKVAFEDVARAMHLLSDRKAIGRVALEMA